jgi:hypothetical protein
MLKETWAVERLWIYFKGQLAQPFNVFFRSVFTSGIDIYWENAYFNHFDRETRRAAEKLKLSREGEGSGIEAASMKTSLSSFLKLFVLSLGFDALVLFAERIFSGCRIQERFSRLKLKLCCWKNITFRRFRKG